MSDGEGPHDVATCPCCTDTVTYLRRQSDALTAPEESPYRLALTMVAHLLATGAHKTAAD